MTTAPDAIIEIWTRAISGHEGAVIVDWRPGAGGGFTWEHNADALFSGASMIKSFLAEMVSDDVAEGVLDFDQLVTVRPEHLTAGDGVLRGWRVPDEVSLHNLVQLMVVLSDNSATNAVIDLLGDTARVNDRLEALGLRSRLRRWVGGADGGHADERVAGLRTDPDMPSPAGLSLVVPREHHELMDRIVHLPRHAVVRRMFADQADRRSLARLLDEKIDFPHKTGTVDGVRHDSGIVVCDAGHELAVTVFTDSRDVLERVDHPACVAMGRAMGETRRELIARV